MRKSLAGAAIVLAASGPLSCAFAQSQPAPDAPVAALPEVSVVGSTPVLGTGTPKDQVPAAVQVLTPQDIARTGIPSLNDALNSGNSSVHINDLSGNPFQPDILFRGFAASPVEGETQGLAVYVNGARFNTPFGDTVNWDLIPSNAIAQVNVEGGNPVFGLNALGGSVTVKLKDGFTFHGGSATVYGGSYGRAAGLFEYGAESGNTSAYIAADIIHDSGWHKTSNSEVRQAFTDLGWRSNSSEVHVSITAADNNLGNPGATPLDLLSVSRSTNSTAPNTVSNHYVSLQLTGSHDITDNTSVQGVLYVANLSQRSLNGNTADYQDCGDGTLCNVPQDSSETATQITSRGGNPIPANIAGPAGLYLGVTNTGIDSTAYGASLQATNHATIAGLHNRLVAGVSADAGDSSFNNTNFVGGLSSSRALAGDSYPVVTPDLYQVPTSLHAYNQYYGAYFTDRLDLTNAVSVNLSGRFNIAEIALHDRARDLPDGLTLDASHRYQRFNPGIGVSWHAAPPVTLYANYSEANRAPTPGELECSNPLVPCQLPSVYVSDPALKQVIAHTVELGARGRLPNVAGGRLTFDADFFRTENTDDIIFLSAHNTNAGGYYANAARTLRQGFEGSLNWRTRAMRVSLGYSFTDATFQSAFEENAGSNPVSVPCSTNPDAACINVSKGKRLPLTPAHRVNLTADYDVTDRLTVGGSLIATTSEFLFGDDANQNKQLGGYVVANANASYKFTEWLRGFVVVNNITDQRYNTYGAFVPSDLIDPSYTNPRAYTPGMPLAAYAGLRATF